MFWRSLDHRRDCARAQRLLADRSVGLLSPARKRWLERHLASCFTCREEEAILREVIDLVDGIPAVEPPPDLWSGVYARIQTPQPFAVWRSYAPVLALGAAAAVALSLSFRPTDPVAPVFAPPPADSIAYIESHALTARDHPFTDQIGLVSYVVMAERSSGERSLHP